jgi:hypothetical protein
VSAQVRCGQVTLRVRVADKNPNGYDGVSAGMSDGIAMKRQISGAVENSMLQIRPNCECCNADLPPNASDARICSFECTFCAACAEGVLGGTCPNCRGELVRRPIRPIAALEKNPASTERVFKPAGCAFAA